MNKKKLLILVTLILMVVGFASVSTTLFLNGSVSIKTNESEFDIYYSNAIVNGNQDKSVIIDDKNINFNTTFKDVDDTYIIKYYITNGSLNYDASVSINCTGGNEYVTVTNNWIDETVIESTKTDTGVLTAKMVKSYTGDSEIDLDVKCSIVANAIERNVISSNTADSKVIRIPVTSVDKDGVDLNATSYEITGDEKDTLLNKLVSTGYITSVDEVNALIEVKADKFSDIATTTFDVSSIADNGDTVVVLHYNESTSEWEYIVKSTVVDGKVTGDFSSYSPVAFVVKKSDGTYEDIVKQVSFAEDDWSTVVSAVKANNYIYKVGDTKTITLDGIGTFNVRVANTSSCTNGEASETACGFVLEFADIITTKTMNNEAKTGGWSNSDLRTYLNTTVYNSLPEDVRNAIIDTHVVSGYNVDDETDSISTDKLYLLSAKEVWVDGASNKVSSYDTAYDKTRQLDYYASFNTNTTNVSAAAKKYNGSASFWWLRTADGSNTYLTVYSTGDWADASDTDEIGVSPAFRIG